MVQVQGDAVRRAGPLINGRDIYKLPGLLIHYPLDDLFLLTGKLRGESLYVLGTFGHEVLAAAGQLIGDRPQALDAGQLEQLFDRRTEVVLDDARAVSNLTKRLGDQAEKRVLEPKFSQ